MTHIRFALIVLVAGCTQAPLRPVEPPIERPVDEKARYTAVPFTALPAWREARHATSLQAFLAGCPRPALARACGEATAVPAGDDDAARRFFETAFDAYAIRATDGGETGLVTGYYEPILAGSRTPGANYRYPVYGVPDDLISVELAATNPDLRNSRLRGRVVGRRLVPYYTRGEIDARGTAFAAPVIAWVADPVELFFLHVQGSGQLSLPNGERLRVGYADSNGHPYRSIGRALAERGELPLEQTSMQAIKAWGAANPRKLAGALAANPSYVFFREMPASGSPVGALGVPLTAEYSVAVDRRYVPLGAPVYLATTWPLSDAPLVRLMAAQDTGAAIRGAVRADFFWGSGEQAGAQAGRMRQQGRMWLLWPRGEALPGGG